MQSDRVVKFKFEFKATDQGRPLDGAREHYDFLLTTVKCTSSVPLRFHAVKWLRNLSITVFLNAPLVHGLKIARGGKGSSYLKQI